MAVRHLAAVAGADNRMSDFNPPDNTRDYGVEALGDDYPFVRASADIARLLSDVWFSHERQDIQYPISIKALHHFGRPLGLEPLGNPDQHQCDVILRDAANAPVADTRPSAVAYRGRPFGLRFYVHEWVSAEFVLRVVQHTHVSLAVDERDRAVEDDETELRVVQDPDPTTRVIEQQANPFGAILEPAVAELDERTIARLPRRLRRIRVGDQVLTGPVIIQSGYNINIGDGDVSTRPVANLISPALGVRIADDTALRPINRVTIAAVAGAGDGVFPLCSSPTDAGISTINNAAADPETGRFTLSGAGCLYVRQPPYAGNFSRLAAAYLRIGNQCTVCRPCGRYVTAYQRGLLVYDQLSATADRVTTEVGRYHSLRDRWQTAKDCCEQQPIKVSILGGCRDGRVVITVAVLVANTTDECLYDVTAEVTASVGPTAGSTACDATAELVASSNFQTLDNGRTVMATVEGHWPLFRFRWPMLSPWRSVRAQATYSWEIGGPTGTVRVVAIAAAAGTPLPSGGGRSDTASVEISCLEEISESVDPGGGNGVLQGPCDTVV